MVISAAVCSDTIVGELQIAPGLESLQAGLAGTAGGWSAAGTLLPPPGPASLSAAALFFSQDLTSPGS